MTKGIARSVNTKPTEITMSSPTTRSEDTARSPNAPTVDLKLEVVVIPVSDVDRAKRFYVGLGWRVDADIVLGPERRVVQVTPPGSDCSIHFGKGITKAASGSAQGMILVVYDMDSARAELTGHGVAVSEAFHLGPSGPVPGPDPEGRSYFTRASFSDPDGNGWVLQEVKTRLPGRGLGHDVATLTQLLREAESHHGDYEATASKHHWSGWYAAYIVAREQGKTPEEAAKDAALHMERARQ
jgi:catechol 2,3-dioxygenase-like lactoylglutathione lyase family enzyme